MRIKRILTIVLVFFIGALLAGCHLERAVSEPIVSPSAVETPRPTPTPTPLPEPTPMPVLTIADGIDPSLDYHPIIFTNQYRDFSNGIVFAGSYGGRWIDFLDFIPDPPVDANGYYVSYIDDCDMPLVRGGETYHMCSIRGNAGTVTGSMPDYIFYESCATDFLEVSFDPALPQPEDAAVMVGVNGDWDPCPRIATPLTEGMGNSIDLDGDGAEEIIHFEVNTDVPADSGSTAIIDYVLENQVGRTRFAQTYLDGTYTTHSEMLFADLNGDGTMEVIEVTGGHNATYKIYEYKNGVLNAVADLYLGD